MIDDNPLERQTEDINNRQGNNDLNSVSKIVLDSMQMSFTRIQEYIEQITDDPNKRFHPQNLQSQLLFLKHFYQSISQTKPSKVEIGDLTEHQKYRLLQLNMNMKIKSGEAVTQHEITQFIQILKKNISLKQETMMKFVGCSSVLRMKIVSITEILDTTESRTKQALKLQIAADWKYIVEMEKQSLQFKDLATKIWTNIWDKPSRTEECTRELNQLKAICSGKRADTPYTNKLITLRKIIKELSNIPDKTQADEMREKKRIIAIALNLPCTLKKLSEPIENDREKDEKNIAQSVLKKRGQIQDRREIGVKFLARLRKNNYAYCSYVAENKFEDEQIKELFKAIGCFLKVTNRKKRGVFDILIHLNTNKHIEILRNI